MRNIAKKIVKMNKVFELLEKKEYVFFNKLNTFLDLIKWTPIAFFQSLQRFKKWS